MMAHETATGMRQLSSVCHGTVLDKRDIHWRGDAPDFSPGDYALLRGTANTITSIAEGSCNPANK
jgi:hypothetical protein